MNMNRWMGLLITFFLILSLMMLYSLMVLNYDYIEFPSREAARFVEQQAGGVIGEMPVLRQERPETLALLKKAVSYFAYTDTGHRLAVLAFCANLLVLFYMIYYIYATGRARRLADLTPGGDELTLTERVLHEHVISALKNLPDVKDVRTRVEIYRRGVRVKNRLKLRDGRPVPEILQEVREVLTRELRCTLGITTRIQMTNRVVSLSQGQKTPPVSAPSAPVATTAVSVSADGLSEEKKEGGEDCD